MAAVPPLQSTDDWEIASSNLIAVLDKDSYDESIWVLIDILLSHPIHHVLTRHTTQIPLSILKSTFSTAKYHRISDSITYTDQTGATHSITRATFATAIGLDLYPNPIPFVLPIDLHLREMLQDMGYLEPLVKVVAFKKSKLPFLW